MEGIILRQIVGVACFYRQRDSREREEEEKTSEGEGRLPPTKYEEELLIGLILIKFQKPTDSKFPKILKNMPKFKPFKLKTS